MTPPEWFFVGFVIAVVAMATFVKWKRITTLVQCDWCPFFGTKVELFIHMEQVHCKEDP